MRGIKCAITRKSTYNSIIDSCFSSIFIYFTSWIRIT
nr:MAG TPA: hypothetical protein [Bacteriophage sp.]